MDKRPRKNCGKALRGRKSAPTLNEVSRPTRLASLLSTLLGRPAPPPAAVPILAASAPANGSWKRRSAVPLLLSTLAASHAYAQIVPP